MRVLKKMICQLVVTTVCIAPVGMHVYAEEAEDLIPEGTSGGFEIVTEIEIPFEEIDPEHLIELDSLQNAYDADDDISGSMKSSQRIDEQQNIYFDTYNQYASYSSKYARYASYYYYNLLPNDAYRHWWDKMTNICEGYLNNMNNVERRYSRYTTEFVEYPNDGLISYNDCLYMFEVSNPHFYFLGSTGLVTQDEKTYYALTVYDKFADGRARKVATEDFFGNVQSLLDQVTATDQPGQMKQIHDLICNNVEYNYYLTNESFEQSAYSSFCLKKTVCTGYVKACALLCNAKGINCIGVYGTMYEGLHAWNKVNLNGNWYNMDLTQDDNMLTHNGERVTNYIYYAFNDDKAAFLAYAEDEALYTYIPACTIDSESTPFEAGTIRQGTPMARILPKENSLHLQWYRETGKSYWYENGVRQGTYYDPKGVTADGSVRGREIYDSNSNGWYWLDACYDGAKACNKEVWMPYIYQDEDNWGEEELQRNADASGLMSEQVKKAIQNKDGKWVRYDENGKMYKGWYDADASLYPKQAGNRYYYDQKTGLMAKGWLNIDGVDYHFDEITGALIR